MNGKYRYVVGHSCFENLFQARRPTKSLVFGYLYGDWSFATVVSKNGFQSG